MYYTEKALDQIYIKELPSIRVASYKIISSRPELDAMNYMKDLIQREQLNFYDLRKFGFDFTVSPTQHKIGLRGYELWVCLPDEFKNPIEATIKNIPCGNYAILRIKNPFGKPFDNISNGWLELHDWVQKSIYQPAIHHPDSYMLEEFIITEGITFIDLYYPVCKIEIQN